MKYTYTAATRYILINIWSPERVGRGAVASRVLYIWATAVSCHVRARTVGISRCPHQSVQAQPISQVVAFRSPTGPLDLGVGWGWGMNADGRIRLVA